MIGAIAAKKAANKAIDILVDRTPVDTSLAVSNWRVGINSSPVGIVAPHGREATRTIAKAEIATYQGGGQIVIVNNVEYIGMLNIGSSSQDPGGFIEAAEQAAELAEKQIQFEIEHLLRKDI